MVTRESVSTQAEDFLRRGRPSDLQQLVVGAAIGPLTTAAQLRTAIASDATTPFQLEAVSTALSERIDVIAKRERRDAAWAAADADRARTTLADDDFEAVEMRVREQAARRAAEFRASSTGQLEELIRINTAILAALEKGGRG